jgi:hypothetical protein
MSEPVEILLVEDNPGILSYITAMPSMYAAKIGTALRTTACIFGDNLPW